jgi:large subunit ribosomal protein L22
MEITAKLNYLRIAPRKMRLLVDLIRGEKIEKAITLLDFSIKKGSKPLKKVLEQAVANAENNFQLEKPSLYISKITIDEGPKLKRWRARARGRAARIEKKTSHITLILSEVKERKKKKVKKISVAKVKKVEKKKTKKVKIFKEKREKILRPVKEVKGFKRVFRRKAF